ncbi:MAG: DNA polymerase III subunit beta [Dissulfurispiraceae bacterium]|jgi:DNA polymerase-3 subunit beta|nr:DNA polymerase III subunit beta [Dissulfurispiraceae bacterium]
MKISVQKEELQKKLSDIQNIVEKKNTMPILSHFLLVAEQSGSFITATDLETAFKEPITLEIAEEGRIAIPARKLLEIAKEMDSSITIESADNQWVKVKSGKSQFRLACLSHEEFPVWPTLSDAEKADAMTIEAPAFLEMIDKTVYAAGEADTRYVLNGLLFHIKTSGELTVVGTDGHRLALCEKSLGLSAKEEKKIILSRKSVLELKKFLASGEHPVKLTVGKNHTLFEIDSIQFLTRLIEGTYPNYEQVLPADNDKDVLINRNVLVKALRRVSVISRERSNAIKVELDKDIMIISASNPDMGEAKDELMVEYSGSQMAVAFNARYMLDAFSAMNAEKVIIRLKEALSPALLLEEGKTDYRCVVMPMRL